jgi:hypothetical protein
LKTLAGHRVNQFDKFFSHISYTSRKVRRN